MENIKKAVVALIIKDGLILAISRRHDKTKFGLIGGKVDHGESLKDALIRETKEECGITIHDCIPIFERVELGDGPIGVDYYSYCYYASSWEGEPISSEEGDVRWLTAADITSDYAPFGDYNHKTLDVFKTMFPNIYIKGE